MVSFGRQKNAHRSAPTLRQAQNRENIDDVFSVDNSIIKEDRITSLLRQAGAIGDANALPQSYFAQLLFGSNSASAKRRVRKMVETARQNGALIASSEEGYYLFSDDPPERMRELRRYIRTCDARVATNRKTTRPMKDELKRIEQCEIYGQMEIENNGGQE